MLNLILTNMKRSDLNNALFNYLKVKGINVNEVTMTNTDFSIWCATKEIVDAICNLFKEVSNQFKVEYCDNEFFDKNEKWYKTYFVNIPLTINIL